MGWGKPLLCVAAAACLAAGGAYHQRSVQTAYEAGFERGQSGAVHQMRERVDESIQGLLVQEYNKRYPYTWGFRTDAVSSWEVLRQQAWFGNARDSLQPYAEEGAAVRESLESEAETCLDKFGLEILTYH